MLETRSIDSLCWKGALEYSSKYDTPIYIDCSEITLDNYDSVLDSQIVKDLLGLGDNSNDVSGKFGKIVLWNLFPLGYDFDPTQKFTDCESGDQIGQQKFVICKEIYKTNEIVRLAGYKHIYIGITLSRCFEKEIDLDILAIWINTLINNNQFLSKKVLISCGMRFKTELKKYGGQGFEAIANLRFLLNKKFGWSECQLDQFFFANCLEILNWWFAKEVIVEDVQKWECSMCKNWFVMHHTKFSKHGMDFCSPVCFKKASKNGFK